MIKPKLHHVTFKTSRLDDMIAWYETVIGTKVQFKDKTAAWMTNDEANHRIAFLAVPGLSDDEQKSKHNGMQREQNFSSGLCGSDDRRAGATSAYSPAFHSRILNSISSPTHRSRPRGSQTCRLIGALGPVAEAAPLATTATIPRGMIAGSRLSSHVGTLALESTDEHKWYEGL